MKAGRAAPLDHLACVLRLRWPNQSAHSARAVVEECVGDRPHRLFASVINIQREEDFRPASPTPDGLDGRARAGGREHRPGRSKGQRKKVGQSLAEYDAVGTLASE